MSDLTVSTKRLGEIYKEWRGNESCYDNGKPVFEADELLDFAEYCLKHEANGADTRTKPVLPLQNVRLSLPDIKLEDAERLSLETDYACEAVGEDINTADAGAFFLEGYLYAQKVLGNEA